MDKTASLSFLQSVFINSLLTSSYPSQPHWFPTPIYSHITALYATVTNTRPRPNSHEEKREEHEIWKKTCGKRGRVFLVRPCISPTSLFLPASLWLSGGWEWWVRWWRVTEVRKERREQSEVCWSSCILAVGGRCLVGIGQVRVSLPTGYAVQLCLYIAQTQLGTCVEC